MTKPTITGNTIQIPIKYLLKKYKKDSGYKEAKKIHGASNVKEYLEFDSDAFICHTINEIIDNHKGTDPNDYDFFSFDVHAAFREVAPVMFKAEHDKNEFIFGWLKKPFAEAIYPAGSVEISKTEQRIRVLKMIALSKPDAILNIKITPLAKD